MDGKTKKTGKARIPDHLRRRALVSCDRCKKRRIRCLRSSGSDASEACQSCLEVGVNCESTLPRKTRIYGSVETLSIRYRVLDALIKGLYPDKDTNNIETLYAIAESHKIELPQFDEQTVAEEVFHHGVPKPTTSSPQASESVGSPSAKAESVADGSSENVVQENMVPMPNQGPSHYIGPSSSFGFVLTVRNMVAEFNAALRNVQPDDERAKISSEFAGSTWSKALDPINRDESDTSSEDNFDNRGSMAGPASRVPNRRPRPSLFPGSAAADVNALSSRLRKTTVLSLIPGKEVTDTFIDAYFDKVHGNYLLFHRPTFQQRYEVMWNHPNVLLKDVEPGWICCIFMMLVFGAQALEERDPKQSTQIQRHYLDLVQARMHQLIGTTTLINVQAILLLQLYQHNNTERNTAFMLLGCASRMAMALGMHREGTTGGFDDLEKEVRKRVWWTAYMFEQNQCAILGRPCAIDDSEINVGFPDELTLDGGTSVPPGYIEFSVRLTKLMSEVRRKIYAAPVGPTQMGESPKNSIAVQFLLSLDSWYHSLPGSLRLESLSPLPRHRRAVVLLHIQFHHVQSLVTRPFVLRKVGVQLARKLGRHVRSQDLDKEEMALSQSCGTFCRKDTLLLHQLIMTGQFDGISWLDAYYIYHSVFILALDFLARPWDEQDTPEDVARKKAVRDVMGALESVKLCATFTILTQVAIQLAKIVGIFDVRGDQHEKSLEYRQYMEQQQQGPFTFDYAGQTQPGMQANVVHNWFQKEPVDLPWDLKDFFGTDSYVSAAAPDTYHHANSVGMTLGGTYNNQLPVGVPEEDLIGPVPAHTAYTHWSTIDTPFAQQQQGGVMKGPGMN